jgi:hypothetical protein
MTKDEARFLRDNLKSKGCKATVSTVAGEPAVRLRWNGRDVFFRTLRDYGTFAKAENQKILDFCKANGIDVPRQRSPIEAMIDKACGLE